MKLQYRAEMPDREAEIEKKKKEHPEVDQIPLPPGEEPSSPIQDPPSPAEKVPMDEVRRSPKQLV